MANKFYVVWVGRQPGIYTTWDQCSKQTNKFSGARFKSFPTLEEAWRAFYGEVAPPPPAPQPPAPQPPALPPPAPQPPALPPPSSYGPLLSRSNDSEIMFLPPSQPTVVEAVVPPSQPTVVEAVIPKPLKGACGVYLEYIVLVLLALASVKYLSSD